MKGYIGFKNGLINGEQKYIENTVIEAEDGIIFWKLPNQIFDFCAPMYGLEFAEIETLDEVHKVKDEGETYITTKLKIGKKISVAELCKRSVPEFFEAFEFDKKIEEAKQSKENCSGDYGVASADNCGAANAGNYGAANAGDYGTANAGYKGVANAGYCGVSIVRQTGKASVETDGAALVLIETDDSEEIKEIKAVLVDGENIKADTYYRLENGEIIEC